MQCKMSRASDRNHENQQQPGKASTIGNTSSPSHCTWGGLHEHHRERLAAAHGSLLVLALAAGA
jgi:hypothetical protein